MLTKKLGQLYISRSFSSDLQALEGISEFKQGNQFLKENKHKQAEAEFSRVLEILEYAGQNNEPIYAQVLLRKAAAKRGQNDKVATEKILQDIVNIQNQSGSKQQVFESQKTLILQYLNSNVDKAVDLGEQVLEGHDSALLTPELKLDFNYLLGTAYCLQGDRLESAKNFLTKALDNKQQKKYVLNNLACAQWWHVQQYQNQDQINKGRELIMPYDQAMSEYTNAIPNFMQAIYLFEETENVKIEQDYPFKNKETGLVINNMGEVYLHNQQAKEGVDCFKASMKLYQKLDPENVGRTLALFGAFLKSQKSLMHAEGLLKSAVEKLKSQNDFNYVFALDSFGKLCQMVADKRRAYEGEEKVKKATELCLDLPYWAPRAVHMHLPNWEV